MNESQTRYQSSKINKLDVKTKVGQLNSTSATVQGSFNLKIWSVFLVLIKKFKFSRQESIKMAAGFC
jgi:hypothetical protein